MGVPVHAEPVAGDWLADPEHWRQLGERVTEEVSRHAREHPLEPGMPVDALRQRLDLPDRVLVEALVRPPLRILAGRVGAAGVDALPEPVARAVQRVRAEYGDRPFRAPEADRLVDLGLGPREIGAAVRAGALLRLADNVVLLPDALDGAVRCWPGCPNRSPCPPPGRHWTPPVGSRCRCWSCWTAGARPADYPTTPGSSSPDRPSGHRAIGGHLR
ncbi:hypothetical protein GCM10027614_10760 [Micromonospora vulcania]